MLLFDQILIYLYLLQFIVVLYGAKAHGRRFLFMVRVVNGADGRRRILSGRGLGIASHGSVTDLERLQHWRLRTAIAGSTIRIDSLIR